jgi:hypothetical protein
VASSGLGRQRWPVERTIAWLHQYRRLRIRWEHRADIHEAFLRLACCLICWRHLPEMLASRLAGPLVGQDSSHDRGTT